MSTVFNVSGAIDIKGTFDLERMQFALHSLIERHESLRTSFEIDDGSINQIIHEQVEFQVDVMSASEEQVGEVKKTFFQPFDLSKAPLMRALIVKCMDQHHLLLIDMHHIISDGLSLRIYIQELIELYSGEELPEISIQYKDVSEWQNQFIQTEDYAKQERFWLQHHEEELPVLNIGTDYVRPQERTMNGDHMFIEISPQLKNELEQLAYKTETTLHMVMLASYYMLLSAYSAQDDLTVGLPVSGRNHDDLQRVIGMFVNVLPLRIQLNRQYPFTQFLQELKEQILSAYDNQDYPFEHLVDKLDIPRDSSRHPIFDTMFILQDLEINSIIRQGVAFIPYEIRHNHAMNDLIFEVEIIENKMNLVITYNSDLFRNETIQLIGQQYIQLLKNIVAEPHQRLSNVSLITDSEKDWLLHTVNQTDQPIAAATVSKLFHEQVQATPDGIALISGDHSMTYKQLDKRSNQVANGLMRRGIKKENIVAIMAEPSFEMIIALLGIIKSGAAFLPIDPNLHQDRIAYMLDDSRPVFVLTQSGYMGKFSEMNALPLLLIEQLHSESSNAINSISESNDLAYVIYTSGTTGQPKGVMVEHGSFAFKMNWSKQEYQLTADDRSLQLCPFFFDGFLTSFFTPLLSGTPVVLASDRERKDPLAIQRLITSWGITYFICVPSLYHVIVNQCSDEDMSSLRIVVLAGEKLTADLVDRSKQKNHQLEIVNEYGPTEGTVVTTYARSLKASQKITIGKPVANTKVYIMSDEGRIQPIGVPGELWIGGKGVARGYLNRPDLTESKFIDNPFHAGETVYKTGDIVRMQSNGEIEYIGRLDDQVKIRGNRIELGEIESLLTMIPYISQAIVIVTNSDQLVAYYVSEMPLEASGIQQRLNGLPSYMMPSAFIHIPFVPLTAAGKVDRKKLPQPAIQAVKPVEAVSAQYQSDTEYKLAEIWRKVLNAERIERESHFFQMGGHSLTAALLLTEVHKQFNCQLQLAHIFNKPVFNEMAKLIDSQQSAVTPEIEGSASPIAPASYRGPLSPAQKRLFVISQMLPNSVAYNMPVSIALRGQLNVKKLTDAVQDLIVRHDALRMSFEMDNGEPYSVIHSEVNYQVPFLALSKEELTQRLKQFCQPFQLSQAPLFRLEIVHTGQNEHILLFDAHHIIWDGYSMAIFIEELCRLYNGQDLDKSEKVQFNHFVQWQHEQLSQSHLAGQKSYWLDVFNDTVPLLNLPTDYPRPLEKNNLGMHYKFQLDYELVAALKEVAARTSTTMFMVLLAAFNVLLSKLSLQEDIVVGTPVSGRKKVEWNDVIGMFVNTLPLRNFPSGDKSFSCFLEDVKASTVKALENQWYPFEELVNQISPNGDLSRNPLFDVMFAMQDSFSHSIQIDGLSAEIRPMEEQSSKFDLTMFAQDQGNQGFEFILEYSSQLFKESTIKQFAAGFVQVVQSIVGNVDMLIADIETINEQDKHKLLYVWNDTAVPYEKEKTVVTLFEEQVARTPNHTAVSQGSMQLTYEQLNRLSNQYARRFNALGVHRGETAAILMDNCLETIIAILAIIKAGGTYVPIDPTYPQERIQFILDDCQAKLVLTKKEYADTYCDNGSYYLIDWTESLNESDDNAVQINQPEDTVYIIYTSGTTGLPKGVMVKHQGLTNYITWANNIYIHGDEHVFPLYSSISFDLTVTSIFTPLIAGNRIVVYPGEDKIQLIQDIVMDNQATIMKLTPTHMKVLKELDLTKVRINRLIVGGEDLSTELCRQLQAAIGHPIKIFNEYGPTETVVGCMHYLYDSARDRGSSVPIGYPADNVQIHILDQNRKPVPYYVQGEIYIAGDGVALGYWNRSALTDERFVDNLFNEGTKMYRTGDLASRLEDGTIRYMGRIDHQIKIRGYRIEPAEIEQHMLDYSSIREVSVLQWTNSDGEASLCAYFVSEQPEKILALRTYLLNKLPSYMVPAYFVQLDSFPLTNNGKVDRAALPEPVIRSEVEYEGPRNEIERVLVEAWQDLFRMDRVSIHDHFFLCGGDSIKTMQLAARLNEVQLKLRVQDVFKYPTIAQLSPNIVVKQTNEYDQHPVEGEVPLSPIQRWFFESKYAEPNHWNQAVMLKTTSILDEKALAVVIEQLACHHDALRMVYKEAEGNIVQINLAAEHSALSTLRTIDLSALYDTEAELVANIMQHSNETQQSFDLENGPLMKAVYMKTNDSSYVLLVIHHLVVDGVSWRILLEDFASGYELATNGQQVVFPSKTTSYKVWSERLQQDVTQYLHWDKEETYWMKQLDRSFDQITTDYERNNGTMSESRAVSITLDCDRTEQLMTQVGEAYQTNVQDILLAALAAALQQWTSGDEFLVLMEGHGRHSILQESDLTRTVGWFTVMYPFVLSAVQADQHSLHIRTIKESIRQVPMNGIGYGLLKYGTMAKKNVSEVIQRSIPEISFNYLGHTDSLSLNNTFEISEHLVGDVIGSKNERGHKLDIQAAISDQSLTINIIYSNGQFANSTIERFAGIYEQKLNEYMTHCLSQTVTELTPHDYGNKNISLEELDSIKEMIEFIQ